MKKLFAVLCILFFGLLSCTKSESQKNTKSLICQDLINKMLIKVKRRAAKFKETTKGSPLEIVEAKAGFSNIKCTSENTADAYIDAMVKFRETKENDNGKRTKLFLCTYTYGNVKIESDVTVLFVDIKRDRFVQCKEDASKKK